MTKDPIKGSTLWKIATLGPLGNRKTAPGTWGSVPGLFAGYLIYILAGDSLSWAVLILSLLTLFSWWVIEKVEKAFDIHDDQRIVIDELCGQAWVVAFFEPSLVSYGFCFLSFRLLDITKPLFIGWVDRKVPGGLGTLLDDVLAGVFSIPIVFIMMKFV